MPLERPILSQNRVQVSSWPLSIELQHSKSVTATVLRLRLSFDTAKIIFEALDLFGMGFSCKRKIAERLCE